MKKILFSHLFHVNCKNEKTFSLIENKRYDLSKTIPTCISKENFLFLSVGGGGVLRNRLFSVNFEIFEMDYVVFMTLRNF